ncbi:amidohydrolase family protein [Urbifossiella limnaea]|uniref:Amidohydrolase n=1 Tax=Urbifossiella limnaea TaxID=2528023 RepID=A0A517Y000_9BACT|nr:amidohydrolase family protein [Urbifossiella limnaea]QDU23089.1 Amidohydrolase [Urbifossiella limnaea]
MRIDVHVHILATLPGHGVMSHYLRRRPNVAAIRLRLGIPLRGSDAKVERACEDVLVRALAGCPELDAGVGLAFDAIYTDDGRRDDARTHLYVANEYAAELARKHRKILFGASVHPYRPDALAELERCVAAGAVLLKWLPLVQGMNPASEKCFAFYEALAHHKLPLLCHTGGELALPQDFPNYASPELLEPALKRGVTVIAAHCGTRSHPWDTDHLAAFCRIAKEHEHFYGDTAALNSPNRSYAIPTILGDDAVRRKLVHGSDWPIPSLATFRAGVFTALKLLLTEGNWLRRDVLVKHACGFDDAYFARAGTLLRLPAVTPPG